MAGIIEAVELSEKQIRILHHTLGLRPEQRNSYRNHFVAGPGHPDMPIIESLMAVGMMARSKTPAFINKDDMVFVVTDVGKTLAVDLLPPAPKRTKYQEYLRSEDSQCFCEWLGINVPVYEFSHRGWRMVRRHYYCELNIAGEWAPTKKEAKASYKEALKRRHGGAH